MADRDAHKGAEKAQKIFDKIAPMLVGVEASTQGNVIALLLGTWLGGHFVPESEEMPPNRAHDETNRLRTKLLILTTSTALKHAAAQDEQRSKAPEARQ